MMHGPPDALIPPSGCDHEHSEQISIAAAWLARHWTLPEAQPFTRALRQRFGLGFRDAVRALAEARRIREGVASSR